MTLKTLQLSETDQKVAYKDQGVGDPLVLIHGVGMQSAAWAPQIDHFSARYHVIALDMPGHGGSDPLPVGSQLPQYVDWCRAVIEILGLGPVNLVGHSMGALIVGGVAATQPGLVQRVGLLNAVFQRDDAAKIGVQTRAAAIRNGKIDMEAPLARWFDNDQKTARRQVTEWLSTVDQAGYATAYTAFANGDSTYADLYDQITCPFLAITGAGDPHSTPAMTKALVARVGSGRAIVIEGHRHTINLTAAEQVNRHLLEWLKRPILVKEMQ